ncbi:tRNA lysidine(34) synthetase TilS [Halalkalibacillus halophilus]|uniref:tRNA lysidine(34) synthetase TilS n=1 Tax=Halalkalibacillus halophilus TaxID=392827 RepID=UPI00040F7DD1|nr:tRNA lysidine(34) synthetase TilS [Halalkalibacillus halophilus]
MKDVVEDFLQEKNLVTPKDHLVIAVSGGVDSMVLLHILSELRTTLNIELSVVTIDHQLREDSSKDSLMVKEEAEKLGVHTVIETVDVVSRKERDKIGTQEAARDLRYEVLLRHASKHSESKVVLAHHGDDQIETMFMQLTKGIKPIGMTAIQTRASVPIIRPLLGVAKAEIIAYAAHNNICYREDPSNKSETYTRNRFRKHLLPFVKEENPNLQKGIQLVQEQMTEDEAFLQQIAGEELEEIATFCEQKVTIPINSFLKLSQPLQRRGFHLILNYLSVNKLMKKDYFPAVVEWLVSNQPNSTYVLGDSWEVVKAYDQFSIRKRQAPKSGYEIPLKNNEEIYLPNGGKVLLEMNGSLDYREGTHSVYCDSSHIDFPLYVRSRKPGDRIRPLGLGGSKKVKDLFIDYKIPSEFREEWPIITDASGTILWVPKLCKSELISSEPLIDKHLLVKITIDY